MSNYSSLKATIDANVKANNNQEITGAILNSVLNAVVNSMGAKYQYAGVATPDTDPGTPDQNLFYIATTPGTYTNFGGIVVASGECVVLKGTGSTWSKEDTGIDLVSVSQNTSTGHTDITIGSTTTPVASVEEVSQLGQISGNNNVNQYIKELYLDFGESGHTLSEVAKVNITKQGRDQFGFTIATDGWVPIAEFGYKRNLIDGIYKSVVNGITCIALINEDATFISSTWYAVTLYDKCLDIDKCPNIKMYIGLTDEQARAESAETENKDAINDVIQQISTVTIKDKTSQLINIDGNNTHYIKTDGSFGADQMGLYKINIEGIGKVDIQTRAYINSGVTSLLYAFYSSETTLDDTTFISGSPSKSGTVVEQLTYNNVIVPASAKTLVIADRGGILSLITYQSKIDVVSGQKLKQSLGYSSSKTILYVKSDGTGDYTTIQAAINAITDARIDNQYEIRLCNDEVYDDMTELWLVSEPTSHNANANPTSAVAAIITKDWISIVGDNFRRKVVVEAPDTMDVTKQQYVQCLYLMGNCIVDNIDFIIKNGRYAIHQESGGSTLSLDFNARTILKNSNVIHKGNKSGTGYWNSCYAQANGACAGLQLEYHNVVWSPAFYMHQNANFDSKNTYLFENCRILYPKGGKFDGVDLGVYIGMNGSGQNSYIEFKGCDMFAIEFRPGMMGGNLITNAARDIRTMIPEWVGYGNRKMVIPTYDFGASCLAFKTTNNNVNVKVVGGTAKADIYGEDFLYYDGTIDYNGYCCGTEFYGYRDGDYSYTLAHRLGNCANMPKTLIVEIGGTQQVVTFDANFVTADGSDYTYQTQPAYSDEQILAYISNQISGAATIQFYSKCRKGYPMNDASEYGINYSNNTIVFGAGVKRDTSNPFGWVNCSAGEVPEGIACERINPDSGGLIALIDKNYFKILSGISITTTKPTGTMLKMYGDGEWTETSNASEAILIAVVDNVFAKK